MNIVHKGLVLIAAQKNLLSLSFSEADIKKGIMEYP